MADDDVMSAFSLTPKQVSFKNNILAGMNPSEALIKSDYKTEGWSPKMISVQAQKLLNNPSIALAVREGQAKVTERAITLASFTKEQAIQWAREDRELAHKLGQSGAAVSANRLACDIAGHIVDKKDVTYHSIKDAPTDELERQLAELRKEQAGHTTH